MKFFHRSQIDDEMEQELRSHIEHRADDLERSGLSRAEAERRARVEFGGRERFKEECREARGRMFIDTLMRDARYSLRVLRKSPAFTAVAVLTLALAIGANAVVFGVLNGFILRPLNVPRAESLYGLEHGHEHSMMLSYPDYLDLRDRNTSFDGLAAYNISQAAIDTGNNPARAWVVEATGNYFDVLGIQPHLGRVFHGADEHGPNSAPYAVLSHAYWHTHFQDDPAVVGRVVHVNKHPFTIIGVTPPAFHGTLVFFSPDIFVPIVNQELIEGKNTLDARGVQWVFTSLGHLKQGVPAAQAVGDFNSIGAFLEKTYPKEHGPTTFKLARPGLYGNFLGEPVRRFVAALMLLAGLILIGACANLGSLFAARAADRSREVALRLALGASRLRILRQLLTEAALIALAGGAIGLWISVQLLRGLSLWHPFPRWPLNLPVTPDTNVYVVALLLAVISGLLFGLVPVRQVLRADPYQIVKAGPGGIAGRRVTVRDVLLVAQIAICGVLVTSSIVAVRGLSRSMQTSLGFEPRNVLLANMDLSMAGYTGEQVPEMQKRLLDDLKRIPGVESIGLIGLLPLNGGTDAIRVYADTATDLRPSNSVTRAVTYSISPGYFQAAGTRLLSGRALSSHDDQTSPRVAVVNRQFAATVFGSTTNAVGGLFKLRDATRVQVVGVVEDGKYMNLTEDPEPAVFLPILQAPKTTAWLVLRATGNPAQLAPAVRSTVHDLDAGLPVEIVAWTEQLGFALFGARMATAALGVMGVLGAMLSVTGIFGMAAYSVSKRLKELGIRIALGAQRKQVLAAALGRALRLLALGSAAGLILGVLATRVLASIVYQATPRDPIVMMGAVLVMLALGLLATWVPAQRALSADPLLLLREE